MLLRSGKSYSYTPVVRKRKNTKTKVTKNVKKYVKKAIDKKQEVKQYIDAGDISSLTSLVINTWSSVSCLSLANGAGDDERIGDKVRLSSIYIGTTIQFPQETFASLTVNQLCGRQCRVIVVQLKRGYSITELIAQLPTDTVTAPLSTDDITRRCYILADRKYDESADKVIQSTTNQSSTNENKHLYFNLKPKITQALWDSTTSGLSQPDIQGAIYLLYLFTNIFTPVAGNNSVLVQDSPDVRINYRDA